MAQIDVLDKRLRSYHNGHATVRPNAEIENDEDAQMFYNPAVMCDQGRRAKLVGVVDSQSFADTDVDYFVGAGGLAGVIGLPLGHGEEMIAAAGERWTILKEKVGLPEVEAEGAVPIFCWIDHTHPKMEGNSVNERWLETDDVVGPVFPDIESSKTLYTGIPRAGLALIAKVCGALAYMGYSPEAVTKVGGLVANNLITAAHYENLPLEVEGSSTDEDWIKERLRLLIRSLLDPKEYRVRSVNLNSNEPVLLINSFGALHHEQIRDVVRETVYHLQEDWNIWPVRVYAGPFIVGNVNEERRQNGFSITLLNVCNTDIGGPSMIDLLDAACDAPIWSFSLSSFFKEIWRDRQLIYRFDTGAAISRSSSPDTLSRRSEESQVSEEAGASDEVEVDREPEQKGQAEVGHVNVDDPTVSADTPGLATVPSPVDPITSDDESVWDDIRAQYGARAGDRSVQHPTWQHTTVGDSLLDLVRSQAAGVEHAPGLGEAEELSNQTERSQRSKKDESDDGFVVI